MNENAFQNIIPKYWPLIQCWIGHFQTNVKDLFVEQFLWNCPRLNATKPLWWLVNYDSGKGCRHQAITWSTIYPDIYCHVAPLGQRRHLWTSAGQFGRPRSVRGRPWYDLWRPRCVISHPMDVRGLPPGRPPSGRPRDTQFGIDWSLLPSGCPQGVRTAEV